MTVYLDYNATTPLDPRVFEAMKPYFLEEFGNAGSRTHVYGQRAREAVERAREQVATLLGARSDEVIFTSGATESNNLALIGVARWGEARGRRHIVTTQIEHKSVLEPLQFLQKNGFEVEFAPVTAGGYVEPDEIRRRLRTNTLLVSVMHANNETGVLQPVDEIAKILEQSQTLFHVDVAQTFGKEVEALRELSCGFLSVSAHKIYGPKGVGVLVARRNSGQKRPLVPLMHGGGQEMGLRPGTLPVPLLVGLGKAAEIAGSEHKMRRRDGSKVREALLKGLSEVKHRINGAVERSQPHVLNICIPLVDSEALIMLLKNDVAISTGSACTSVNYEPSHVLLAMGLSQREAQCSVRLSWGRGVSVADLPIAKIAAAIAGLR